MLQTILTTASESLAFLPALLCNLVFFTLTGWVLWFRLGGLLGQVRGRMTILLVVGLFGLVFVGFLSLGLAMAGWFSAVSFFGVWALSLGALAFDVWRRGRWAAHVAQWRAAQPIPGWFWLLLCLWLLLYGRPFEMVIGGSDPGVYINIAAQIAEQGTISVKSPVLNALAPRVQEQLGWNPSWLPDFITHKLPGYFWIADSGKVLPQFFHFYPALMAPSYGLAGYEGALTVLPVIVLIFALLLAELAQLLVNSSPRFASGGSTSGSFGDTPRFAQMALRIGAASAAFFLLLNPAMLWFGRFANADVPYGLFVFAALFFWARSTQQGAEGQANWLLASVCLGAALLTKIDFLYLLPAVFVTVLVYHPARKAHSMSWLAWCMICALFLTHLYFFSYPYFLLSLRSSEFEVPSARSAAMLLAAASLVALTIPGLIPPILNPARWELLQRKLGLPSAALPMMTGLAGMLGLVALVIVLPRKLWMWASLDVLLAYVPWPTLIIAAIGIVLLISRVQVHSLALPLLAVFFSSGMFIILQTPFVDHPWSERRATSVALPMLMLFAGVALAELMHRISRLALPVEARHPSGRGQRHVLSRTIRWAMAGAVLAAVFLPMAWRVPPIFAHQEADGASVQLRLLESLIPEDAVIYAMDSRAMNLFGPGLGARGGREILAYYSAEGKRPPGSELVEGIGDAALAADRPFFYVTESDDPPPGHFLWARAWWGEWNLSRMFSKDSPEPLTVVNEPVPYRIYRSLGVAPAADTPTPSVRLYEAEALLSQTGRIAEDPAADNGRMRVAEAGRDAAGALVYGPYVELPPGSYIARYHLRTSGNSVEHPPSLAVLGAGARQLASRQVDSLAPVYSDFDVPFDLQQREKVEFSLMFDGVGQVWLDWVEVVSPAR